VIFLAIVFMEDMMSEEKVKNISQSISSVEHPSIAASLEKLGMLRDVEISESGDVSLTLVLPFPQIPENIQKFMINSLGAAVKTTGGELQQVKMAVMDGEEKANFLAIETQNWRG